MGWLRVVSIALALTSVERVAAANGIGGPDCPKPTDFAIGGSVAHAWHPQLGKGVISGVDAVIFPNCIVWAGGGLRVFEDFQRDDRTFLPYIEGGVYLLVNIGVGYTMDASRGNIRPERGAGFHLFFGEPIPLVGKWYVEPYYRVSYLHRDALNELGLLIKWSSWDFHDQRGVGRD